MSGWSYERLVRELRLHLGGELLAFYATILLDRHRLRRCARAPRRLIEHHHERFVAALHHRVRPEVSPGAALDEAVHRVRDVDPALRELARQIAAEQVFDALRDLIVAEDEAAFWQHVRVAADAEEDAC